MEVSTTKSKDQCEMNRRMARLFCALISPKLNTALPKTFFDELTKGLTVGDIKAELLRKREENYRLQTSFWKNNPPSLRTTVPNIQRDSELFDVLTDYHIAKVEYILWIDDDDPIKAWLPSDIRINLRSELPEDDPEDENNIGEAICQAIEELALQAIDELALPQVLTTLERGWVIFDVRARRISLEVTFSGEINSDGYRIIPNR